MFKNTLSQWKNNIETGKSSPRTPWLRKVSVYVLLFFGVLAYFTWLNAAPGLADPDSFYHARISEIIMNQGIVKDFPWLPLTTLKDVYIDHHLLYHLLLVPFIRAFGDPLVGTKVAAILFGTFSVLVFQWFLDKRRVKFSWVYTGILILTDQFIFRMNLAKTSSLSLIVILLWLYFLLHKKKKWLVLFLLGFIYVWLYAGWVIMFGLAIVYWGVSLIFKLLDKYLPEKIRITNYQLLITSYKSLATIGGIVFGLVINPYFPKNLFFYWQQTIKIGFINYKDVVQVGNEWYGFNPVDFIGQDVFIFVLLVIALVLLIIRIKQQPVSNWFWLLMVVIFGGLTIKAHRNIEYFAPLTLLFAAQIITEAVRTTEKTSYLPWLRKNYENNRILGFILAMLAGLCLVAAVITNVNGLYKGLRGVSNINKLRGVAQWLENNSEDQEIIFHDNWSDWPIFFFHNQKNAFIAGLDPSFLYFKDPEKYKLWVKIATGDTSKYEGKPCAVIKKEFNSRYIFLNSKNNDFRLSLARDDACGLVYQDEEGFIYEVVDR